MLYFSESFPDSAEIGTLLSNQKKRLTHFFTRQSKEIPCISASNLNPSFWRATDCHNRSTERRIGILKEIINKIFDAPKYMNPKDIRLRAYMCNLDLKLLRFSYLQILVLKIYLKKYVFDQTKIVQFASCAYAQLAFVNFRIKALR